MTNIQATAPVGKTKTDGRILSPKVTRMLGIAGNAVIGSIAVTKPNQQEIYEQLLKAVEGDFAVLAKDPTQKIDWSKRIVELRKVDPKKDYDLSIFNLKKLQKQMHEQINADFKNIGKNVENWGKDQKQFEVKRGNVVRLIDSLSQYTGREEKVAQERLRLDQAGELCRNGDIAGGLKLLIEIETSVTLETKTADDRQKLAKSNLKDLTVSLQSIETQLTAGADVLPGEILAAFTDRHRKLALAVEGAAPLAKDQNAKNKINTQIGQDATKLLSELQKSVPEAKKRFDAATKQLRELDTDATARGSAQASSDAETVYHKLQDARQQIAARAWDDADARLLEAAKLLKTWQPALPTVSNEGDKKLSGKAKEENDKAQKAIWDAAQKFIEDADAETKIAREMQGKNPKAVFLDKLPVTVAGIDDILSELVTVAKEATARFLVSEGLEALKQARAANAANRKRLEDYAKLAEVREKQGKEVGILAGTVDEAVLGLKKTMANPKLALPTYEEPLTEARQRWTEGAVVAMTAAELPFEPVTAQLKEILSAIEKDKGSPATLIANEKDSQFAALAKTFGEKTKLASNAATLVGDQNFTVGDDLLGRIGEIVSAFSALKPTAQAEAGKLITAMDKLAQEATKLAGEEEKKVVAAKKEFDAGASRIEVQFATLNQFVAGDSKLIGKGKFERYLGNFEALVKEFSVLSASTASTDASVLQAGTKDLAALEKRVGDMITLFKKIKEDKVAPTDVTLATLEKRGKDLDTKFGKNDEVKKLMAKELADLKTECTTASDAIDTAPLDASTKSFDDLDKKWTALQLKAKERGVDRGKFMTEVGKASSDLSSSTLGEEFPTLAKSLAARLKALNDAADATGEVDRDALAAIAKELSAAIADKGSARVGQQQIETAALDKALSDKRWAAEYTAFQGKIKALSDIADTLEGPTAKGFRSQRDELKTSAEGLNKSSGKTPYETLSSQLQTLVARVDLMIRYPMGQATHARGSLPAVDKRWNQAIGDFQRDLGTVGADLKAAMGDDFKGPGVSEAVDTAQKKATALANLFTAGTLTPLVKDVVTAGSIPAKNKAEAAKRMTGARDARETALAEVKRMQRMVDTHPRLVALGRVPFDVKIKSAIGNLRVALFDLETNLLISL